MAPNSPAPIQPVLPSRLQAAVEAHLLGDGFTYTTAPAPGGMDSTVRLWNHTVTFSITYSTFEEVGRVLLQLDPAIRVPDSTRGEVALLFNWINAHLHCCTFHLLPGRPDFRLRICLAEDLKQEVTVEGIERMTNLAVATITRYSPIIRDVAMGRATALSLVPRIGLPTP